MLAAEPDTFWTDQFHNTDALDGYAGIGRELLEQAGGRLDVFCGAVGTGGMLRGVVRALREGGSRARIVALEPAQLAGDDRRTRRRASRRGHRDRAASRRTWRTSRTTRRAPFVKRRRARWRGGWRARKGCSSARRAR